MTRGSAPSEFDRSARRFGWLVLLFGMALLLAPTRAHLDDSDAHLYRTIARHMVEDGSWTHLRYLKGMYPQFYEHLPFGLWPLALAVRWFGEGALPFVGALFSLGTMFVVWRTGAKLMGEAAGAVSPLVLCTTESFIIYGARGRLDQPLLFFATSAAAAVLCLRNGWLLAIAAASLAALIKGPFGLVPLAAAAVARAWRDRSWRALFIGAMATAIAAVPVAAFLLHNHLRGDDAWWNGYVRDQILASAVGGRSDGFSSLLFPWQMMAGRFWPGLPLVVIALVQSIRSWKSDAHGNRTTLVLTALLSVAILCLPKRKLWHHALVTFPLWSLAAGAAVGPWLERVFAPPARRRRALLVMKSLAGMMVIASAVGVGRLLVPGPCIFSRTLSAPLAPIAQGSTVLLISEPTNWQALSVLAAEKRFEAWPLGALPAIENTPGEARYAVIQQKLLPASISPWRELARADGWVVLQR